MRERQRFIPAACLTLGALLLAAGVPREAHAVLQLSFTATDTVTLGTNSRTFVDGGNGDTSAPGGNTLQDGVLTLPANVFILPDVVVNGSTSSALGTPQLPGPTTALSSGSSSVLNNSADLVHIVVAVSATNFEPGRFRSSTSGSGTFQLTPGSTMDLGWYDDPANTQGANTSADAPGILIDSFHFLSPTSLDSFSFNDGPFPVSVPDVFGTTLTFVFTLKPGGSLISRGQSEIKEVPEPASLLLFGAGMMVLGLARERFPRRGVRPSPLVPIGTKRL